MKKIEQLNETIKEIRTDIDKQLNPTGDSTRIRKQDNSKFLEEASAYLSDAFKEISTTNYVEDITLTVGDWTNASLDIELRLKNGKHVTPINIFSEANYDLLILLLYVSIIRVGAQRGQSKVIILDDVLQSVDSTIRSNFIDYLLRNFADWQIIITTHDRLWLNQLCFLFHHRGHEFKQLEVRNWNFDNGPMVMESSTRRYDKSLEVAIQSQNKTITAAMCGIFLEQICQHLSMTMGLSIKRRMDDKYTIGDLWPALMKEMKKTSLNSLLQKIDRLLYIRNLIGCHYNEWAQAISDSEINGFAKSVQGLYDKVFCSKCFNWIKRGGTNTIIAECACHDLLYEKLQ